MDLARLAGLDTIRVTAQWSRGQTALEPDASDGARNAVDGGRSSTASASSSRSIPSARAMTPLTEGDRADFADLRGRDRRARSRRCATSIVGNEPNLNRFWLPQFGPDGEDVAAPAYATLLAQTYDALKAVARRSTVCGGALAPRGSDRAGTRPRHALADRLHPRPRRRLPRERPHAPIMDAFAFHPVRGPLEHPAELRASETRRRSAIADYDKLVALLGKAFDGTAQRGSTLPIVYDEFGVETTIPAAKAALYTGTEPATASPSTRRRRPPTTARRSQLAFCQPNVADCCSSTSSTRRPAPAGSPASTTPTARRRRASRRPRRGRAAAPRRRRAVPAASAAERPKRCRRRDCGPEAAAPRHVAPATLDLRPPGCGSSASAGKRRTSCRPRAVNASRPAEAALPVDGEA